MADDAVLEVDAPVTDAVLEKHWPGATALLEERYAERAEGDDATATPAAESPEPSSPPPAEAPATTETPAPEPSSAAPPATAAATKANEPALQPASWQPSNAAREAIRALGWSDEVVSGFSSEKDLNAALMLGINVLQQQRAQAPSPSSPPEAAKKSKLDELLDDPINADDPMVQAMRELREQNQQLLADKQQREQAGQQWQQREAERHQREFQGQVDAHLDSLKGDFFGESKKRSPEQLSRANAVAQKFYALAQSGAVQDYSPESWELARFAAFPAETKEQLRRTLASEAQAAAEHTVPTGRITANTPTPPASDWHGDRELLALFNKLQRGEAA